MHPGTSGRAPVRGWSASVLRVCNARRALEAAIHAAALPVTCVFAGHPRQPLKVDYPLCAQEEAKCPSGSLFYARSRSPCQDQHSHLVVSLPPSSLPVLLQGHRCALSHKVLALELRGKDWEALMASDEKPEVLAARFLEALPVKKGLRGEWPRRRAQGHSQWVLC